MTLNQSALLDLTDVLRTADGGQVMRLMLSAMLQALVDAEAAAHIGADPYERTPTRMTHHNGTREKTVSTTAGDLMVKIPSRWTPSNDWAGSGTSNWSKARAADSPAYSSRETRSTPA